MEDAIKDTFNLLISEIKRLSTPTLNYLLNKTKYEGFHGLQLLGAAKDYVWEEINTGKYDSVPKETRKIYYCLAAAIAILELPDDLKAVNSTDSMKFLKQHDYGYLLGGPMEKSISSKVDELVNYFHDIAKKADQPYLHEEIFCTELVSDTLNKLPVLAANGLKIDALIQFSELLSIERFIEDFFTPRLPVKIEKGVSSWPAVSKWVRPKFWYDLAGFRLVPVEIGSNYLDPQWTQDLVLMNNFLRRIQDPQEDSLFYLAQFELFDQFPQLRNDFSEPLYCGVSPDDKPVDVKAWFGAAGTVSPLHQDPRQNILCQVFGTKTLLLAPPDARNLLSPHPVARSIVSNTSQIVDPFGADTLQKYPDITKVPFRSLHLRPGDMVYIPTGWWHYVRSESISFSVSFWFG